MGVRIVLNHKVENVLAEKEAGGLTRSSSQSARNSASTWTYPRATR